MKGVTPTVQFVKVVSDELTALMGGERFQLEEPDDGPQIILMAGLQGVGKTTVCAKIARYLQKENRKVTAPCMRAPSCNALRLRCC